ncbi:MAG: DUF1579 domain-containing protein [Candidatus Eisenbacteria bacterium]|nr:DUF1579 domain-containing protein [Candidatus Eisenbacteria bacterium]
MNRFTRASLACFGAALVAAALSAATVRAEEPAKPGAAPDAAAMAFPKPTPEHALLKAELGTWDADIEMAMAPGQPAEHSKGVRTCTMRGELWLVEDMASTMMGLPFQGLGVTGYDTAKGRFVCVWVDAMGTYVTNMEGSYDKASAALTFWAESPGPDGKMMKWRSVTQSPDANTRVWTAYMPTPDGKEFPGMKITYKRRKA